MHRHILLLLVLGGCLPQGTRFAFAQFDPDREVGVRVSAKGIGRYSPGRWGLVELRVMNRGETDVAPVSVSWLQKDKNLEFSRQLEVPAGTIRTSWYPIFIPESVSIETPVDRLPAVDLQSNTRFVQDGTEKIKRGDSYDRVETLPLRMFGRNRCVAFLADGTERQMDVYQSLTQLFQTLPLRSLIYIDDPMLPATSEGYDVADVIIVAGDRVAEDEGALSALLDWVLGGGTLWVMLDHVSPSAANQIFGDLFSVDAIDHVALTDISISSETRLVPNEVEVISTERPVDFLRVLTSGVEVTHRVDGWPAAFSRKVGTGQIVCTTLGLQGWYVPNEWDIQENLTRGGPRHRTAHTLMELLSEVILAEHEHAVPPEAQESFASSHIGVEIPGRTLVLCLLGGFFVLLVTTAFFLKRLGRIEVTGFSIPILTIAVVAGLSAVGVAYRSEPDRVAQFQLLTVEPGQPLAHMQGVAATYAGSGLSGPFAVPHGGTFLPERSGTGMGVWRRDQEDPPAWSFSQAQIPAGVRMTPFHRSIRLDGPVSVEGTFDSTGFTGTVNGGQFGEISDVTIAGRTQFSASPDVDASGRFTVTPGDILPPGEFLSGKLLDDEQQRRQLVLQKTLNLKGRHTWFPQRLTMLGWTQPVDPGIGFPIEKHTGSALLSIPVTIRRPPPATSIRIPSLFMTMHSIWGDAGKGFSSAYSNRQGVWNEKQSKGASTMRFQIPPELLPVDVSAAMFRLKISAPLRKVVLSAGPPGNRIELVSRNSMVGDFSFKITDPTALTLDNDGGLQVVLDVGDVTLSPDEGNIDEAGKEVIVRDESWQVYWMQLEVTGKTSDR